MADRRHNGRFIWRLMNALDREEQGYPPIPATTQANHYQPGLDDPQPQRMTVAKTHEGSLIPPQDKLLVFRALVGIDNVPALVIPHHDRRAARNIGIYSRIVSAEEKVRKRYKFFSMLVNTCLAIQIIVSAAVTATGAASGPHSAITAFGAINTIMAGVLTYLKGSGLPDRLKHYQTEWRNIREYIEQREREFCLEGCSLDVQEEIQIIESMYETTKGEVFATKSGEHSSPAAGGTRRPFFPTTHQAVPQSRSPRAEAHSPVSIPEPVVETH